MKSIILVVLAVVAVAIAAPSEVVEILRSDYKQQPEGSYNFDFEASNGITREEVGTLKEALDEENKPHNVIVVRGSYSYPDENGKPILVTYEADENGYRAVGDSIPKPVSSTK